MGNKKFITMLERQIDLFVGTFQDDADNLFKGEYDGRLIHPGEYGMYRERCFKALLQNVLSREEKVSDGFIITSFNDTVSTQCDVLVRNANSVPLTDNGIVNFYPVEDVYAIIEVKSNLSKADFKKSLRKLAENKKLSDHRMIGTKLKSSRFLNYDYIPSFLICNKLDFRIRDLNFDEIYEGIERRYWHNAILSILDGALSYRLPLNDLPERTKQCYANKNFDVDHVAFDYQYSLHAYMLNDKEFEVYNCPHKFIKVNERDKYQHIMWFLCAVKQAVNETIKYHFDGVVYLGMSKEECCVDYENNYEKISI